MNFSERGVRQTTRQNEGVPTLHDRRRCFRSCPNLLAGACLAITLLVASGNAFAVPVLEVGHAPGACGSLVVVPVRLGGESDLVLSLAFTLKWDASRASLVRFDRAFKDYGRPDLGETFVRETAPGVARIELLSRVAPTELGALVFKMPEDHVSGDPIPIVPSDVAVVTWANPAGRAVTSPGGILPSCRASDDGVPLIWQFSVFAGFRGGAGRRDGASEYARFDSPTGGAVDADGNLYFADTRQHTVRKVTPTGMVTTLAGDPERPGYRDGKGSVARFYWPRGVAIDASGNVIVADTNNHAIRRVSPTGEVTTLAGVPEVRGFLDGDRSVAKFSSPVGLTVAANGTIYVADTSNRAIRMISIDGKVTTVAGGSAWTGRWDGPGKAAYFCGPTSVQVDSSGAIFVADRCASAIRRIDQANNVKTIAGSPTNQGFVDGAWDSARFRGPSSIALDPQGNLYVADTLNYAIRKVSRLSEVTTIAGSRMYLTYPIPGTRDGYGRDAHFAYPTGLVLDRSGDVYIADEGTHSIRRMTPAGLVETFSGPKAHAEGSAILASGDWITVLTLDRQGNAFVVTSEPAIRKVDRQGRSSVVVNLIPYPSPGWLSPRGLAVDDSGGGYFSSSEAIYKFRADGNVSLFAGSPTATGAYDAKGERARFKTPSGLLLDDDGSLFVADTGNSTIRKISPDGDVTTVAGRVGGSRPVDGQGTKASFVGPFSLARGPDGIYILESTRPRYVRKLSPSGYVSTVFQMNWGMGDGVGDDAAFYGTGGFAVDSTGALYVADTLSNTVRRISPTGDVTTIGGDIGRPGVVEGKGPDARFEGPGLIAIDRADRLIVSDRGLVGPSHDVRLYRGVECPLTALCLAEGRFRTSLRAKDPRTGSEAVGEPYFESDVSGFFSLPALTGDKENPEVFVKVLDGRPVNGHFWVFHGGLTDLEYTLTVTDTASKSVKTYVKPALTVCGDADTNAFAASPEGGAGLPSSESASLDPTTSSKPLTDAAETPCSREKEICLQGGRFGVSISAKDPRTSRSAEGLPMPRTNQVGYFSLPALTNDVSNPEIFVKLLDGREVNGNFWLFFGGLTDFEVTVNVRDTATSLTRTYIKPSGSFCGGVDTDIR